MNNLTIDDSNIVKEAISNMQIITLSDKERPSVRLSDIKTKILNTIKSIKNLLYTTNKKKKFYFYVWHDFQAGQLRFSFISKPHPPFGSKIKLVKNMDEIINDFLAEAGGVIEFDELSELPKDDYEEEKYITLKVYMKKI